MYDCEAGLLYQGENEIATAETVEDGSSITV